VEFCFTCWEFPFRSSFFWPSCGIRSPGGRGDIVQPVLFDAALMSQRISIDCSALTWRTTFAKLDLTVIALLLRISSVSARIADGNPDECGLASVYSTPSEETASGQDTSVNDRTAAHRSLPFGTLVHIDNQENGHSAVVRITDRGPFVSGRIVDVSQVAAHELGFYDLTKVCVKILSIPEIRSAEAK